MLSCKKEKNKKQLKMPKT